MLYSPRTARASFWKSGSLVLEVLEAIGLDLDDLGERRLAGEDVIDGQIVGGEGVRVGAHLLDDVVVRVERVASRCRGTSCARRSGRSPTCRPRPRCGCRCARPSSRRRGPASRSRRRRRLQPVGERLLRDREGERQPPAPEVEPGGGGGRRAPVAAAGARARRAPRRSGRASAPAKSTGVSAGVRSMRMRSPSGYAT